jgi:hypothetical protein
MTFPVKFAVEIEAKKFQVLNSLKLTMVVKKKDRKAFPFVSLIKREPTFID